MLKIKGKVNTAICYASSVEDEAIEQIKRMCDQEFTRDSKIRIMPDVHAGKGCTIGTTMTIVDKIVPNIVGVDIGCGMYTVKLGKVDIDLKNFDKACYFIPSGRNVWQSPMEYFDLIALRCYKELKDTKRLERSLATLGGGNHFIEIGVDSNNDKYLVVHSGSRNLGKQVAEYYQKLAIDLHAGKDKYDAKRKELIDKYKKQGRGSEIQSNLKMLEKNWSIKESNIPKDLCYLYGSYLKDYIHDVEICQKFAKRNREKISEIVLERTNIKALSSFHTIHNYIDSQEKILRKGAISAHKDEVVLIPINMRDGSILAKGKGNPEWNFSAPHGAGRIMSRTKAKETFDLKVYKKTMEGIYSTSINKSTLDEAPMAYKAIADIIEDIKDCVEIIDILKPIYNFKAAD